MKSTKLTAARLAVLVAAVLACVPAFAADPPAASKPASTAGARTKSSPRPPAAPGTRPATAPATAPTMHADGGSSIFDAPPAEGAPGGKFEQPSVDVCRRMATETLLMFDRAVARKSFALFHGGVSRAFAAQASPDALLETFGPFVEHEAKIAGVEHVEPIFDPDPLVQGDVLKLKGFYPTRPMRVLFDFDYLADGGRWRLNALTVTLKGAPAAPAVAGAAVPPGVVAPSGVQLNKLVTDTMLELDRGIKRKNFASLLANASTPMRWQTKPQQLTEAFATFIENKTDLSAIANAEPQFEGRPVFKDKTMAVSGHFRVLPQFVLFHLDYYYEAQQWKLLAISVNTLTPAEHKRGAPAKARRPAPGATDVDDTDTAANTGPEDAEAAPAPDADAPAARPTPPRDAGGVEAVEKGAMKDEG